jgi:hypothetical protein
MKYLITSPPRSGGGGGYRDRPVAATAQLASRRRSDQLITVGRIRTVLNAIISDDNKQPAFTFLMRAFVVSSEEAFSRWRRAFHSLWDGEPHLG